MQSMFDKLLRTDNEIENKFVNRKTTSLLLSL